MEHSTNVPENATASVGESHSFHSIVTWKKPVETGIVVLAFHLVFGTMWLYNLTVTSLFLYCSAFLIAVGGVLSLCKPETQASEGRMEIVSRSHVEKVTLHLYDFINDSATKARELALWRNSTRSATVLAGTVFAAWVSRFFSNATLVFLQFWLVFTHVFLIKFYGTHLKSHVDPLRKSALKSAKGMISKIPKIAKKE
eukprot:Trichotokara_eunicae@DN4616_c0_g1_i2.p1